MDKKWYIFGIIFLIVSAGFISYFYFSNLDREIVEQFEADVQESVISKAKGDPNYIQCLVKTSDNVLSKDDKKTWTQDMLDEEKRGNYKQGYIVLCRDDDWQWGNLETDPSRFAIIRILRSEFNSSWLDPVTNASGDTLTRRAYKLPLDEFMTTKELDDLKNISYNEKVNWSIYKNVTNLNTKVEVNDYDNRGDDLILHGSAGTFYVGANGADCPGGTCNYSLLTTFEAGEQADLTGTGSAIAELYGDGFTDRTNFDGWTTTANDWIKVIVPESDRHQGNISSGFIFQNNLTSNYGIRTAETYFHLEGLILNCSNTGAFTSKGGIQIAIPSGVINITNNIIIGHDSRNALEISVVSIEGEVMFWNNILIPGPYTAATDGIRSNDAGVITYAYSNTIINTNGACIDNDAGTIVAKNNICNNSAGTDGYEGTFHADSDYNAGTDNTPPGANNQSSVTFTFANVGGDDYHLDSTDTGAKDLGTDLSADTNLSFSTDIEGDTRSGTWDIGADEYTISTLFPRINFTDPTPANNTESFVQGLDINVSIITTNISEFIWNWNGTNISIFNDDLIILFNFDNVSALGEDNDNIVDMSGHGNDGEVLTCQVITGKYGNARSFNAAAGYNISIPTVNAFPTNNLSVSIWVYDDNGNGDAIVSYGTGADANEFILYNADALTIYQGGANQATGINLPETTWVHLAYVWDTSGEMKVYVNGTLAYNRSGFETGDPITGGGCLVLGQDQDSRCGGFQSAQTLDGYVDEFYVYNTTLTDEEVYYLYASHLSKINESNWVFGINQSKNATVSLEEGTYTYQAFVEDINNQLNYTEERTYNNLDSVVVTLVDPTDINTIVTTRTSSYVNATIDEAVINCTLHFNGTDYSMDNNTEMNFYYNETGLGDGQYYFNVTCRDPDNNLGTSEHVHVNISTGGIGNVSYHIRNYPTNGSIISNPFNIDVTYVDLDEDTNLSVQIYVSNDSNNLNYTHGLIYDDTITPGYNVNFQFDAIPIPPTFRELTFLMRFDNISDYGEDDDTFIDLGYTATEGSCTGSACPVFTHSSGKFAGSFEFDGVDDVINMTDPELGVDENVSFSFWLNPNDDEAVIVEQGYNYLVGEYGWVIYLGSDHDANLNANSITWSSADNTGNYNDGVVVQTAANSISMNTWQHVAIVKMDKNITIYIDGVYQLSELISVSPILITKEIMFGREVDDTYYKGYYNGSLDDFAIFNTTLNATEVQSIYEASSGKYYWQTDVSDQYQTNESNVWEFTVSGFDVELISPVDNHVNETTSHNFICNTSVETGNIDNVTLFIWNSTGSEVFSNVTSYGSSQQEETINTYNFTAYGSYTWNCLLKDDNSNEIYASDNYTFIYNDIPSVTINNPVEGSLLNKAEDLWLNFSVTDTQNLNITVYLNNQTSDELDFHFTQGGDIHWQDIAGYKDDNSTLFINTMNAFSVDLVFVLGDILNDETDSGAYPDVNANYSQLTMPFNFTTGNHDLDSSDSTWSDEFGSLPRSFDMNGIHFVLLENGDDDVYAGLPIFDATEEAWLENDLESNKDKPIFILSHINMLGLGPYAANDPGFKSIVAKYNSSIIGILHAHNHRILTCYNEYDDNMVCSCGHISGHNAGSSSDINGYRDWKIYKNGTVITSWRNRTNATLQTYTYGGSIDIYETFFNTQPAGEFLHKINGLDNETYYEIKLVIEDGFSSTTYNFNFSTAETPTVTFVDPTDINTTITTRNSSYFNVTIGSAVDNCTLDIGGSSHLMTEVNSQNFYHNISLANGVYNYSVTCRNASNYPKYSREYWIEYNFTYGTCTCPGLDQDWEVDMSDNCTLSTTCDLGTGLLSFINTGNFYCDAQLDFTGQLNLSNNMIFWVNDTCTLYPS